MSKWVKIAIIGDVDSGKTSFLEALKGQRIRQTEERGITQQVNFEVFSREDITGILRSFNSSLEAKKGIVFIDTPGHRSFLHLKKVILENIDGVFMLLPVGQKKLPDFFEEIAGRAPLVLGLSKIDKLPSFSLKYNLLKKYFSNREDWIYEAFSLLPDRIFEKGYNFLYEEKSRPIIPFSSKNKLGIILK